ncbi:MAG: hypothetical protein L3J20_13440 [Flavobacteriaceae bacterium]|nr:hypothetical protein [Flavobacteriaceae bacterium]
MKNILILGVFLTLTNCTMRPQNKIDHSEFKELHKHKGSENYEVIELINKKNNVGQYILVDKVKQGLIVSGYKKDILNETKVTFLKRISILGNELEKYNHSYRRLNDGTLWRNSFYVNWIINGDTTKHKYLDPFSNQEIDNPYKFTAKEKNFEKWFKKFKELYAEAQYIYIYIDISFYYFKIENKWYLMDDILEESPSDLEEHYPAKEDQDIRMVELQDMSPVHYYAPPKELDTSLIKKIDYESTYYEEKKGLDSFKYSAGWWYLEIYMPLGDTIKIKRYSYFQDPELRLYKIPGAYDGRYDVLFIVQKPNPVHMEQVAGMYVIRPKDPTQPQQRYSLIVYKRDTEGYKVIDKEKSVESEEYKAWVKKQRK